MIEVETYYVVSYEDVKSYRFIGWSKNEMAVRMYSVAGKFSLPFVEHYAVFEYSVETEQEFIEIVHNEWEYLISGNPNNDDHYISLYVTEHGDMCALSNREYNELVLMDNISYQQGRKHMFSIYELLYYLHYADYIRDKEIVKYIGYMFHRYSDIYRGSSKNPRKISKYLDDLQSYITLITENNNVYE